jgi:hypothetical protein
MLSTLGMSYHQQGIVRVERRQRPLRLEGAQAVAEILGINMSLCSSIPTTRRGQRSKRRSKTCGTTLTTSAPRWPNARRRSITTRSGSCTRDVEAARRLSPGRGSAARSAGTPAIATRPEAESLGCSTAGSTSATTSPRSRTRRSPATTSTRTGPRSRWADRWRQAQGHLKHPARARYEGIVERYAGVVAGKYPDDLVFTSSRGQPLRNRPYFNQAAVNAGLGEWVDGPSGPLPRPAPACATQRRVRRNEREGRTADAGTPVGRHDPRRLYRRDLDGVAERMDAFGVPDGYVRVPD